LVRAACRDVLKIGEIYDVEELRRLGGAIDYVVGTPLTKVYCLAEHPDPKQQHYLNLYKMGPGSRYSFFIPYHLVHFEAPNAVARAVLFRDPTTKPLGGPVVEVSAVAKRDLKAGEVLDDYGMYMTHGEAVNADEMSAGRYLREGLVHGCRLKRSIAKDGVTDVVLPAGGSAAGRPGLQVPRRDLAQGPADVPAGHRTVATRRGLRR
jgi:predicted homoserine dehydrogenase-like protein